jgi:hypothetical protein
MSKVDEELTRRFHRAERPVGSDELFEGLARRRRRRRTLQRVQAGALAVVVLAATAIGFLTLQGAFDRDERTFGDPTNLPANGEIVFSREGDDGRFHLFAAQPDGSGVRQITSDATNDTDPSVSPGGETIAYVHELDQGVRVIATVPIDGGIVSWHTPETMEANDPAWSSSGDSIAFVGWAKQSVPPVFEAPQQYRAIFTVDATNGSPRRVTDGGIPFTSDPTWSPGDLSIAFAGGSCESRCEERINTDLYVVEVASTDVRRLTTSSGDVDEEAPAWSPGGSRIAFTRRGDQGDEVWTVAADGTDETLLATAVEASLEPDLAWAPDGTALLVSDGACIYRVDATPVGDPRDNFVRLVRGVSPSWQPIPVGSELAPTINPQPSISPSPEPAGRDIGVGFNLCDVERLDDIDWFGDEGSGSAWTGTRVDDDGRCGRTDTDSIVAADLDGDEIADVWSPIDECIDCRPWAATDLDGNGTEELIVMLLADLEPTFGFYFAVPDGLPRSSGLYPIPLAGPGAPGVDLRSDRIVTIQAGASEEGVSGNAIRCEGYPENPVLVLARWVKDEGAGTVQYHGARLGLEASGDLVDAHFVVVDTFTPTASSEDFGGDGRACGVDFNPWN